MTDTDQSKPSPSPESAAPAAALAAAQAGSERRRTAGGRLPLVWLALLVLLAVILGAALYYQQQQYQHLRADLQQLQQQNTQLVQEAQSQAAQALSLARGQAAQVQDLSNALDATNDQVQELDQALQLMTDSGSDLLLLNDIDHLVSIAQQQLSLGGNVANAIISLEAAQAQLARANRPALAALQQSINGDLDRLRAVATIDLPALSDQVDQLSELIGVAPLLVPDDAAHAAKPPASAAPPAGGSASGAPTAPAPSTGATVIPAGAQPQGGASGGNWQDAAADAWRWTRDAAGTLSQELRSLFDVRRVDDSAALLMSPDQALRFREGLRQRAVMAQLALMMHQSRIWQTELAQIAQAIDQRYDMRSEASRKALKLARDLHDTPIETRLPTVDNSLAAIAAARDAAAAQDAARQGDAASAPDAAPEAAPQDESDQGASVTRPPAGAGPV